jgi:hypothetical protein
MHARWPPSRGCCCWTSRRRRGCPGCCERGAARPRFRPSGPGRPARRTRWKPCSQADAVTVLRMADSSTSPARELDAAELLRRMVGCELPSVRRHGACRRCGCRVQAAAATRSRASRRRGARPVRPRRRRSLARARGACGSSRSGAVPEERAAKGLVPTFALREPVPACALRLARARAARGAALDRASPDPRGRPRCADRLARVETSRRCYWPALARRPRPAPGQPTQGVDGAQGGDPRARATAEREGTAIVVRRAIFSSSSSWRIGSASCAKAGWPALPAASATRALLALACGVAA